MRPELFSLFGFPLYSYGVMLMIGFLGALWLARALARRSGIDPEVFINAGLIALVTGIVGARLSHVLENWHVYTDARRSVWDNFVAAVNIRSGGLTFYGGFMLAFPCTVAYGLIRKVPIKRGMDIVAPCVLIGLGFGRIGCLLNGCCYGEVCNPAEVPWAITYPYGSNPYVEEVEKARRVPPQELRVVTEHGFAARPIAEVQRDPRMGTIAAHEHSFPRHPAQIYSTITAFLLAGLLVAFYTTWPAPGRVMALMLILEAPSRFLLELLRVESPVIGRGTGKLTFLPPMSYSMVISVGLLVVGVAFWFLFKPKPDPSAPGPQPAMA